MCLQWWGFHFSPHPQIAFGKQGVKAVEWLGFEGAVAQAGGSSACPFGGDDVSRFPSPVAASAPPAPVA